MVMFRKKLIPESELRHLKDYSFKPGNFTFLDNVMLKILWEPAVKLLPRWLSANILTLTGGFCIFLMNFLVFYYVPNFKASSVPGWVSLVSAILIFTYTTLDGVDGMQARRLKLASPLGQLLDHGTDALVASFFCYFTFLVDPTGYKYSDSLITISALINTAAVNWQEEIFGTFSYTNGFFIFGVSEPLLSVIIILCFHYAYPKFWLSSPVKYLWKYKAMRPLLKLVPKGTTWFSVFVFTGLVTSFYTFFGFPYDMFKKHKSPKKLMQFTLYLLFNCVMPPLLTPMLPQKLHALYAVFVSTLGGFGVVFIIFSNLRKTGRKVMYLEFAFHYLLVFMSYALVAASRLFGRNYDKALFNCSCFRNLLLFLTVYGAAYGIMMTVQMLSEIREYLNLPFFSTKRPEKKAV